MLRADGSSPSDPCSAADISHTQTCWMPQSCQLETKTSTSGRQTLSCSSRISSEYHDQSPHSNHHFVTMPPTAENNREGSDAHHPEGMQLSNQRTSEQAHLTDWYQKCKSSCSKFSRMTPKETCSSTISYPSNTGVTETQSTLYHNEEIWNRTYEELHHEKLPSFHNDFVKKESGPLCLPVGSGCVTETKKRKISRDAHQDWTHSVFEKYPNPIQVSEMRLTMINDGDIYNATPRIKTEQNSDTNNSLCQLTSHFDRNETQTLCRMYQNSVDNKKLEQYSKIYCKHPENWQGNLKTLTHETADNPSNYANLRCFNDDASIHSSEHYARKSIFNFVYQNPLSIWEQFLLIERELCVRVNQISLPLLVTHVYNPLDYAFEMHCDFVQKFCNSQRPVLFLGMNPGPFGMSQTGVPFGEVDIVKSWLHVTGDVHRPLGEHPKRPILGLDCKRKEVSGNRFWNFIKRLSVSPHHFFKSCFVHNLLPLAFMSESGKNVTVPQLPAATTKAINEACDAALCKVVKLLDVKVIIGVGKFAQKRAAIALKQGEITEVRIETIMHPSPRNPAANRGWEAVITKQLQDMDALKYLCCNDSVILE